MNRAVNFLFAMGTLVTVNLAHLSADENAAKPKESVKSIDQKTASKMGAEFLKRYEELGKKFDPALADLYTDNAKIKDTRTYPSGKKRSHSFVGKSYKKLLKSVMPLAKQRGDYSTFSEAKFSAKEATIRIDAKRFSELKKYDSPIVLVISQGKNGKWRIVEQATESRP